MKTNLSLTLLAAVHLVCAGTALFAAPSRGEDSKRDGSPAVVQSPNATKTEPCCSACCAELKPTEPLSARSLYQLEAKWTNDSSQPVQLAALRGRPVVIAMFFASCEYACPVLVSDMQRLRDALPADVRGKTQFVLVSFDTARDTPAALKAYRERAQLSTEAWTLLQGDTNAVQELAMLLGVKFKQDARGQFSHSNLITVLNREGEIVHQRAGLMGDVSEAAKTVSLAAK